MNEFQYKSQLRNNVNKRADETVLFRHHLLKNSEQWPLSRLKNCLNIFSSVRSVLRLTEIRKSYRVCIHFASTACRDFKTERMLLYVQHVAAKSPCRRKVSEHCRQTSSSTTCWILFQFKQAVLNPFAVQTARKRTTPPRGVSSAWSFCVRSVLLLTEGQGLQKITR